MFGTMTRDEPGTERFASVLPTNFILYTQYHGNGENFKPSWKQN